MESRVRVFSVILMQPLSFSLYYMYSLSLYSVVRKSDCVSSVSH